MSEQVRQTSATTWCPWGTLNVKGGNEGRIGRVLSPMALYVMPDIHISS